MERQVLNQQNTSAILDMADQLRKAKIFEGSTQKPFEVQSMTFDLATARLSTDPFPVKFPFKSIYIPTATDVLATVSMIPQTRDSYQSAVPLKQNDSWVIEDGISEAFFYWPAQAGKTITLLFFVSSEFRSGSQISVTGGGVSIVDGSTITGPTRVTLAATTATIIAPSLSTRKKCTMQNKTGADLYIGGATIGAVGGVNEGIKIPNDGIIYWQNTGALYGWSVAGGNIHYVEEA